MNVPVEVEGVAEDYLGQDELEELVDELVFFALELFQLLLVVLQEDQCVHRQEEDNVQQRGVEVLPELG